MKEKKLEDKLVAKIRELGGLCIKLHAQSMAGLPDRMCLLNNGRIFFVELKSSGQKPRKIQRYIHEEFRKLGFEVFVFDSSEQIMNLKNGA
jgi:hypothetical protein